MAERTNTKKTQAKSTPRRTKPVSSPKVETTVTHEVAAPERKERMTPKKIDENQYITVKNGSQGKLVYVSRRTGEKYIWDSFGDEQEMELRELKSAKNSQKGFFINNWFMFDGDEQWVLDYLGVRNYYKYVVQINDFDKLFDKNPEELKEIISTMSKGQKRSVIYRANELIVNGEIDSRRTIAALEEALGVELVEH